MRVALRIDVDSLLAARDGVPRLLKLFEEYKIQASFFFSVGPDNSGRSWERWCNSSLLGWRPLLNGTLLNGAVISDVAADMMNAVVEAGHEIGLKTYDAIEWKKKAAFADAKWSSHQFALALEAFEKITSFPPERYSATGFQINRYLLEYQQAQNFTFASDTRGKYPYYPELQGVQSRCLQIPVTLPTLQQALAESRVDKHNVHEYLFSESRYILPAGHVYAVNAGLEGVRYIDIMEKLLVMWQGQEGKIRSLGNLYNELDMTTIQVHQIGWEKVPGYKQHLATQSVQIS